MRGLLFGLVCAGLALPLHDLWMHPDRVSVLTSLQVDAQTYHDLATTLAAHGHWTDIPLRQPPGFVALLAVVYRAFGASYTAAKLLLWLCLVASAVLAAWLARRVWGRDAAWAAALLVATAPALRHYTGTVQYEVLAGTELLVLVALAVRADTARGFAAAIAWTAAAGVAAGTLALTREVFAAIIPIVALWLAWRQRASVGGRRAAIASAVFLTLAAVPVAGWSAAQSQRFGQLVVLSDKGPVTFALGNNPLASGTYDTDTVVEPSGLRFLRERPAAALRLAGRKFLYFWGILRDPWNVPRPAGLWLYRATAGLVPLDVSLPLARGGWLLLALLVAVGALATTGRWAQWWLLPAVVGAVCLAHVATLSSHRFAVPVLPVVFVLAAGPLAAGATALAAWLAHAAWRRAGLASVLLLVVMLQWLGAPPPAAVYSADALDGMNAHRLTAGTGTGPVLRLVPASASRPGLMLGDEYLAAGRYQLSITAQRLGDDVAPDLPVARVTVLDDDGAVRCREDVPAGLFPRDGLGTFWVPCTLAEDGPMTLTLHGFGPGDLGVAGVAFVRNQPQP